MLLLLFAKAQIQCHFRLLLTNENLPSCFQDIRKMTKIICQLPQAESCALEKKYQGDVYPCNEA